MKQAHAMPFGATALAAGRWLRIALVQVRAGARDSTGENLGFAPGAGHLVLRAGI